MNRHPGGQPVGGRFAPDSKSTTTGVDLDPDAPSADREAVADAYRDHVHSMLYGESDQRLVQEFAEHVAARAADGEFDDDPELADLDDEWHAYRESPDPADYDWAD